ncbi:MAG: hypothetical protein LBF41_03335 [Deltaproteobacteria bacterium]|nr:hypothetical protein [Deltaproteobacteria bacterium]
MDNYVRYLSADDYDARKEAAIRGSVKTGDTPEIFLKKTRIIHSIVLRLSAGQGTDSIARQLNSLEPGWKVDSSDVRAVKSRFEELREVSLIAPDPPFSGIRPVDVESFIKLYSVPDIDGKARILSELLNGGGYSGEDFLRKMEVVKCVADSLYVGYPEEFLFPELNLRFPLWHVTRKDIDAVLARRDKVLEVEAKIISRLDSR